jgi:hypothetical protein
MLLRKISDGSRKRLASRVSHMAAGRAKNMSRVIQLCCVTRLDDDERTSLAVLRAVIPVGLPASIFSIARRWYCRTVLREVPAMTKLAAHGTRSPICAHDLTGEDRSTFRRWARGCTIAYSVVIVALLALGFALRDTPDSQLAKQSPSLRIGATAHF